MLLEVQASILKKSLNAVQGTISKISDISSHILFDVQEKVQLYAFNDLSEGWTPLEVVSKEGSGVFSIPFKSFKKWVSVLEGSDIIKMKVEKGKVQLSVGKGKISLPSDTMAIPKWERLGTEISFNKEDFYSAFKGLEKVVAKDHSLKELAQFFYQNGKVFATNRLVALMMDLEFPPKEEFSFGIHVAEFNAFKGYMDSLEEETVEVRVEDQDIFFFSGDSVLKIKRVFQRSPVTTIASDPSMTQDYEEFTTFLKSDLQYAIQFMLPATSDPSTLKLTPKEKVFELSMSSDTSEELSIEVPFLENHHTGDLFAIERESFELLLSYCDDNVTLCYKKHKVQNRFNAGAFVSNGKYGNRVWRGVVVWKVEI